MCDATSGVYAGAFFRDVRSATSATNRVIINKILAKILTAALSIVNYRRSYAAARVQLRDWMISGR